jgi:hypothetical protein
MAQHTLLLLLLSISMFVGMSSFSFLHPSEITGLILKGPASEYFFTLSALTDISWVVISGVLICFKEHL